MSGRTTPLAVPLLGAAVLVLPGDVRDRYREEFQAELDELGRGGQVLAAAGLLRGSLSLRRALLHREGVTHSRTPLRCRLGRHQFISERDVDLEKSHHTSYRCAGCGAFWEPRPSEEAGFDIETQRRNANFLGGGGW